jgi:hypothetical protein
MVELSSFVFVTDQIADATVTLKSWQNEKQFSERPQIRTSDFLKCT